MYFIFYSGLGFNFVMFGILQIIFVRKASDDWMMYLIGGVVGAFSIPITSMLMAYSS